MYVGHLQGANFAEIYFKAHPSDIAALVLLEPGDPTDLLEDFHGTRAEAMRAPECATMCFVAKILGYSGLTRAMAAATPGRHFPGAMKGQYRAGLGRPSHSENTVAYYGALPKTAYQDRDVKSFGNTAVLLFNSSELRSPEGSETIADVQRWRVRYLAFLRSLAAKSTRGSGLVEVPHSTHATLTLDAADADFIAKAIVSFAAQLGHKS
jgi:pimeloyl-ACP methyl ester carboxylesterase